MLPGPTIIRRCSACKKMIAEHTLTSGNTFGARYWTDGKRDAPMLPVVPWLVKCPHCRSLIWRDEQEQVEELEPWLPPGKDQPPVTTPTLQDYFRAVSTPVTDAKKEKYIRVHAWWAGNDLRREGDKAVPMSDEEIANLRALLALLDDAHENDRLMKAEAMRELGMFAEAETLLAGPFCKELISAVEIIRALNQQRDSNVAELRFE